MKKFKEFSITKKLLTAFLSVIAIMLVVGAVGITGMVWINHMDTYLYEEQTAPIQDLIDATSGLNQFRSDSRSMVLSSGDAKELDELEQNYYASKEKFEKSVNLYLKSVKYSNDILLLEESLKLFKQTYAPAIEECLQEAKSGDQKKALMILNQQNDTIEKLDQNMKQVMVSRMQAAKKTSDNNNLAAIVLTTILCVVLILGSIFALFFSLKISKIITTPINQIVEASSKIALGQLDVNLKNIDSKDETGQLAAAFTDMLEGIRNQVLVAEDISNGDFTKEVPLRSQEDVLGIALRKIEKDLNRTLLLIRTSADQVNTGAEQVSSASQALASGSTEQAATVEELNASIAAVAQQADQNATNVRLATNYVKQSGDGVLESNAHMQELKTSMRKIDTASEKISNITKVIEDIAFQTNILALNAAIEAARAGNAGKGFAVVADEVRNLATKSAEAAKETASLISRSVEAVSEGEEMTEKAAKILEEVAEKSKLVEQIIKEIENASSQQVVAIEEINQGLTQVSSVVQTNAATAEESSASSEELAAQSVTLQQEVSKFKLMDENAVPVLQTYSTETEDTDIPSHKNKY
ncbi:methyl-accepting chemotaxis protein [Clostridium sp. E02]|uniref:methyl-accepting chemotaxis protein n=1 Tax=Clostridium sp. E02 TaxID=2487134 RepID=UPI000F533A9C|nr:methyl-accepting chemotaxis protein [Clostridium sp. E02]